MKSKKTARQYIIEDYPGDVRKFNRHKTDYTLLKLKALLCELQALVEGVYETDPELFWFIHDHIHLPDSYYLTDMTISRTCEDIANSIDDLQTFLKEHNDEIVSAPFQLEDLGFKDFMHYNKADEPHVFERQKEYIVNKDKTEKEITEEVVIHDNNIARRLRTTLWDIVPHGKSSRSIRYRKLPMTKKLAKAAENTIKRMKEKEKK